jgi:hypothetical protein
MTAEREPIEIDDNPELLRLVEELEASGGPCVLRRGGQDVAVVLPVVPEELAAARPTTADSGLWKLVGIGSTTEPTDIGEHKHEYLADAYLNQHRE